MPERKDDEQRILYRALLAELDRRGIDYSHDDVFLFIAAAFPSDKSADELADIWQFVVRRD